MLADVAGEYPQVTEYFQRAGECIERPLWEIASSGPETELNSTEITQPALLTASVALWEIWNAAGGELPSMFSGHSLGEYSALVCAGSLSLEEGVLLVHERGKLMQKAVPHGEGAMAAVLGLDDDAVADCCEAARGIVSPANFNAPGQVVIAGATAAVEAAVEACREAGARRAVLLPVSGPFHCELMRPAQTAFADVLAGVDLKMPSIPIVHNVDGEIAPDLDTLRAKLMAQIAEPVLWTRCAESMVAAGITRLLECGPGKVLSGLVRRIDKSVQAESLGTLDGLRAALG